MLPNACSAPSELAAPAIVVVLTPTIFVVCTPTALEFHVPPAPTPPEILISTVVPLTVKVLPRPMKLSWVIPAPIVTPPD